MWTSGGEPEQNLTQQIRRCWCYGLRQEREDVIGCDRAVGGVEENPIGRDEAVADMKQDVILCD